MVVTLLGFDGTGRAVLIIISNDPAFTDCYGASRCASHRARVCSSRLSWQLWQAPWQAADIYRMPLGAHKSVIWC